MTNPTDNRPANTNFPFPEEPRPGEEPRYTVTLTTEGWQIKDNLTGTIGAEFWTSSSEPEGVCYHLNAQAG